MTRPTPGTLTTKPAPAAKPGTITTTTAPTGTRPPAATVPVTGAAAGGGPVAVVPAPVRSGPPHTPPPRGAAVAAGVLGAAGVLVGGGLAGGVLRGFLDRMAGVVALVALSLAVMVGLATALRGLLPPRARTAAQHLHRALGVLGVGFLLLHIGVKVAGGRVAAGAAALGWGSGDALVGLGTLACYLFLLAVATGVWRGVFATRRWIRPFRVLHGASYAGWVAAVLHGLTAGRAPAPWVVASYALCLTATAATLAVRLFRNRSA
ncbi:ferric reductase-like transmembrane domain-containing protein [Streptomyces collinus]|uniref:ferric reductase-like transmembrane domain-containing protein n=1 Tax=Streptomyces collinus TaxID=42684 RepID=UPI002942D3AE|nr:ferric reductase-like transmembrane domain-containing protein [Streptomyces collinus]